MTEYAAEAIELGSEDMIEHVPTPHYLLARFGTQGFAIAFKVVSHSAEDGDRWLGRSIGVEEFLYVGAKYDTSTSMSQPRPVVALKDRDVMA